MRCLPHGEGARERAPETVERTITQSQTLSTLASMVRLKLLEEMKSWFQYARVQRQVFIAVLATPPLSALMYFLVLNAVCGKVCYG